MYRALDEFSPRIQAGVRRTRMHCKSAFGADLLMRNFLSLDPPVEDEGIPILGPSVILLFASRQPTARSINQLPTIIS
jgi:hypothetical protein